MEDDLCDLGNGWGCTVEISDWIPLPTLQRKETVTVG